MYIFRDPGLTYKEDIHTGAAAAARGGFYLCDLHGKYPGPWWILLKFLQISCPVQKTEKIHIYQTASVSKGLDGKEMTDFKALSDAGACGFTDDGIPLMDGVLLLRGNEKSCRAPSSYQPS